jgi:aspartyl-tRNA(Asn)/glutamyl-tRNA(Gln) amidotransferase subunit B
MFCSCKNDPFFSESNNNVCPVCLGLPGAMPVPNFEAIKLAQTMAYHLGGELNPTIVFERKNYFYPDLPKSFQLTCPHYPILLEEVLKSEEKMFLLIG